jgi:preprotein translocase subunit SecF
MSRLGTLGNRLYRGEVSFNVVGRRRRWLSIFGTVLLLSILGFGVRGLHFSVDFSGGSVVTVPSSTMSIDQATSIALKDGAVAPTVAEQKVITGGSGREITVTTTTYLSPTTAAGQKLQADLAAAAGVTAQKVTIDQVSASWGHDVSVEAFEALIIFLCLVTIYLAIFFEWKMAIAALVSLLNVIVITVGVYAWSGLEVSPSTVVGFLTILGYSMYDTVVVFDKVKENKRNLVEANKMGYRSAANLAVNQTLVRSLNTSLIALMPVAALLLGGTLSDASVLQDLALALLVGIASGTISSILVATPLLVWLKELEPAVRAQEKRLSGKAQQRPAEPALPVQEAVAGASAGAGASAPSVTVVPVGQRQVRNQPTSNRSRGNRPGGSKKR